MENKNQSGQALMETLVLLLVMSTFIFLLMNFNRGLTQQSQSLEKLPSYNGGQIWKILN